MNAPQCYVTRTWPGFLLSSKCHQTRLTCAPFTSADGWTSLCPGAEADELYKRHSCEGFSAPTPDDIAMKGRTARVGTEVHKPCTATGRKSCTDK